MGIQIIHGKNEAGMLLLQGLQEIWKKTSHEILMINQEAYYRIVIPIQETLQLNLNSFSSLQQMKKAATKRAILECNGISCGLEKKEIANRSYEVLVFNTRILSIKESNHSKNGSTSRYLSEKGLSGVIELARRVVYLLGLDYARVRIVRTGGRRLRCMDVDDSPLIRSKDRQKLIQCIQDLYQSILLQNRREIMLGADPEFMMVNSKSGRMIAASRFFPREGEVGCDNIRVPGRQQRPIAEIRPQPSTCPYMLHENIKKALLKANKMAPYKNIKWLAGSQPLVGYSIGGHIHFSNVDFNHAILRALDSYLGILVFLIEDRDSAVKRRKRYGYLADVRKKDYGGFEYRTPGSWLVSEALTRAILCLAKLIACDYPKLQRHIFSKPEAFQAFYEGDKDYFRPYFPLLWHDIQGASLYKLYQSDLEWLREMLEQGWEWDEKADLRKNWGIPIYSSRVFRENRTPASLVGSRDNQQAGNQVSAWPERSFNRVPTTYSQASQHHVRIVIGG